MTASTHRLARLTQTMPEPATALARGRSVARRLALAAALALATTTGLAAEAPAQVVCGAAYQELCAVPGWNDRLDDTCDILDTTFIMAIGSARAPCIATAPHVTP